MPAHEQHEGRDGRVRRARDPGMRVREWFDRRSFHYSEFGVARLAMAKVRLDVTVSLVLPTLNVSDTIGDVLRKLEPLVTHRPAIIDQVLVIDADSRDGTADIARVHGAEVYSENDLMPSYGKALGKGDAMWRSLAAARGDIIVFADADSANFAEHFILGALGPLLVEPGVRFVKAAYQRPFVEESGLRPHGGGRVTELMAKPLFNLLFPRLAGFVQPLAGEFAATRELLRSVPFFTGYGVEAGMLIDVVDQLGLGGMAQVDLGVRLNRHQDLTELSRMSYTILRTVLHRAARPNPHLGASVAALRDEYLHAAATSDGLHLEEYVEELVERPPMCKVSPSDCGRPAIRPARTQWQG